MVQDHTLASSGENDGLKMHTGHMNPMKGIWQAYKNVGPRDAKGHSFQSLPG